MNSDAIELPDAPEIRGLRFRHFRGGRDFSHMATIIRASAEADDTERSDTPEELEHFFAHLTNCDPYTDMIFAEVDPGDGREPDVIGYSRGMWRMEGSGERRYIFFGRILPVWRRKGIGQAMLRWMEERLREMAAGHPVEVKKYFMSFVAQGETGLAAMLEKTGYGPVRYILIWCGKIWKTFPIFLCLKVWRCAPCCPSTTGRSGKRIPRLSVIIGGSLSQARRITRPGSVTR